MLVKGGDIHSVVFPDEASCVNAGKTLFKGAIDDARRKKLPPPPGWICMPSDSESKKVSS